MTLTQKQIGQRLSELRKIKGWSQDDLARKIRMSRPSLAQLELGNRSLDVIEFQLLAKILEFSMDQFMSKEMPSQVKPDVSDAKKHAVETRISVPELRVMKLRNILLYMLERCAGKPNVGETVLYKLLYFSDFNYYERYEEHLTGARYRKLTYGPVPQKLDIIIRQMIEQKMILRVKSEYHGYPQTRYMPLQKADLTQFKASEKEVVDQVIDQMSDWSAAAVSDYSHKDIPWIASQDGKEIDYELAFYRIPPFSVRNYGNTTEER